MHTYKFQDLSLVHNKRL